MSCENILEVKHLCISASRGAKEKCLVGDINFSLGRGKVLGIVGESGSGKSITCYAVTGLLNPNLHISGGSIVFRGDGTDTELVGLCEKRYRKLRGSRITMVFQEPMSALTRCKDADSRWRKYSRYTLPCLKRNVRRKCLNCSSR